MIRVLGKILRKFIAQTWVVMVSSVVTPNVTLAGTESLSNLETKGYFCTNKQEKQGKLTRKRPRTLLLTWRKEYTIGGDNKRIPSSIRSRYGGRNRLLNEFIRCYVLEALHFANEYDYPIFPSLLCLILAMNGKEQINNVTSIRDRCTAVRSYIRKNKWGQRFPYSILDLDRFRILPVVFCNDSIPSSNGEMWFWRTNVLGGVGIRCKIDEASLDVEWIIDEPHWTRESQRQSKAIFDPRKLFFTSSLHFYDAEHIVGPTYSQFPVHAWQIASHHSWTKWALLPIGPWPLNWSISPYTCMSTVSVPFHCKLELGRSVCQSCAFSRLSHFGRMYPEPEEIEVQLKIWRKAGNWLMQSLHSL